MSQFAEALRLSEQTHAWLLRLPVDAFHRETPIGLLLEQERLSDPLGRRERQEGLIDQLLSLLEPEGPSPRLAEVYTRQGELFSVLDRSAEAEEVLQKALAIRRNLSDRVGERNTLRSLGFSKWQHGHYREPLAHQEAALAISRQSGDPVAVATDLTNLGSVLRSLGRHEQALSHLTEALGIFDARQDPRNHQYALHATANLYRDLSRSDEAMRYFRRAHELQVQQHLFLPRTVTLNSMAMTREELDRVGRKSNEVIAGRAWCG